MAVRWRHGVTPLARFSGDRGRSARRPRRGSTMPGLRSTRPRLPVLAMSAVAILILAAACGEQAPPPAPTAAVVATKAPQVEELPPPRRRPHKELRPPLRRPPLGFGSRPLSPRGPRRLLRRQF